MNPATPTTTHPRQLYMLFFTEMWERFSFYGMKALLLAYMVTELNFDEPRSYAILGSYAGLVYTMPIFGGLLADKILGYRKAVLFGGVLMMLGHFILAIPAGPSFFYGMAFIICGNGFFKPNISSLVGTLYEENDKRKDSAFSIFYMGINLGALLGGVLCGYIGQQVNWHLGFGLAGIFMIAGLVNFLIGQKKLGNRGLPPANSVKLKLLPNIRPATVVYVSTILVIPLVVLLFNAYKAMDWVMLALGLASLLYIINVGRKLDKTARFKLFAALVMIVFSILFWAFYNQYSGSLNLFAIRNVDMQVGGMDLPPLSVNNFLPPFWVITLSPVFAWFWLMLNKKGREPGTAMKFTLSFIFLAIGFGLLYLGCMLSDDGLIALPLFVVFYFAVICGELCLSPIGLSMVTKLSPGKIVGLMMGTWFLATAIGEFLAGKIGALMSVPKGFDNPAQTLPVYADIIKNIALGSAAIAVLLFLLFPLLKKWMQDVK